MTSSSLEFWELTPTFPGINPVELWSWIITVTWDRILPGQNSRISTRKGKSQKKSQNLRTDTCWRGNPVKKTPNPTGFGQTCFLYIILNNSTLQIFTRNSLTLYICNLFIIIHHKKRPENDQILWFLYFFLSAWREKNLYPSNKIFKKILKNIKNYFWKII